MRELGENYNRSARSLSLTDNIEALASGRGIDMRKTTVNTIANQKAVQVKPPPLLTWLTPYIMKEKDITD